MFTFDKLLRLCLGPPGTLLLFLSYGKAARRRVILIPYHNVIIELEL